MAQSVRRLLSRREDACLLEIDVDAPAEDAGVSFAERQSVEVGVDGRSSDGRSASSCDY